MATKDKPIKEYIGDSVYVNFDGYLLTLTTENGYGASNTIHLEPEVQVALVAFVERIVKDAGTS